jgi:hypothetical protein
MRKIALVICFLLACTPDVAKATRILEGAGYTNIQLGGYTAFKCSDDDGFNVAFTAVGVNGAPVEGAVCCGVIKSCTIRVD